jgi:HEAT repeat protein
MLSSRTRPAHLPALLALFAVACASSTEVKDTTETQLVRPDGQVGVLVDDLVHGSSEERVRAAGDLASMGSRGASAAPYLIQALENDEPDVRSASARAMSFVQAEPAPVVEALAQAMEQDTDDEVAQAACQALGRIGAPAVDRLMSAFETGRTRTRMLAAQALGIMGSEGAPASKILTYGLRDVDRKVRAAAAKALGRAGLEDSKAVQPLVRALEDEDPGVRAAAAWTLGEFGDRARWTTLSLVNMLKDPTAEVRSEAARALGKMGPSASQAALDLQSAIEFDPSETVRHEAAQALRRIRNEPEPGS